MMKKTRYYPFERNRYFYGKLLTVRDFESEQIYFNNKRRMLNRLMYGTGVVSGLQVVAVDDKSISVEMGMALDSLGREVVISSPVTLKLSMIEGFTNNEYAKNVYLCVGYDEKGKEPVHTVANSSVRSDEISEYNRVLESYKLFIKEDAPDASEFELDEMKNETSIIYQDSQIRILQVTPKYVNPEDVFEVTLIIQKTLQTPQISFECEIEANHAEPTNKDEFRKIVFTESGQGQESEFKIRYGLKASTVVNSQATVSIKEGTGKLSIGDRQISINTHSSNTVQIIEDSVSDKLLHNYYSRSLEGSISGTNDQSIYLAKISLLKVGSTYMIEKVETVPFGEYIYNPTALFKLGIFQDQKAGSTKLAIKSNLKMLPIGKKPELTMFYDEMDQQLNLQLELPEHRNAEDEMATGVIEISMQSKLATNLFAKAEKNFYSNEIKHGLGNGPVYIMTGIEQNPKGNETGQEKLYQGDQAVFNNSEYVADFPNFSMGTLLYPKKGSFIVGVRTQHPGEIKSIKVRWWAFKKQPEDYIQEQINNQDTVTEADQGLKEVATSKEEKE